MAFIFMAQGVSWCNRPRSPKSLCSSVVEHRSANPNVWGSIPHGDSEFFFITLVTRQKNIFLSYGIVQRRAYLNGDQSTCLAHQCHHSICECYGQKTCLAKFFLSFRSSGVNNFPLKFCDGNDGKEGNSVAAQECAFWLD